LTHGRIAAADGRFDRIRQVAPMCPPVRAHWRHLANTIEPVLPSAHPSPQPKRKIDRVSLFAQLTAESPYTLQWATLSYKITASLGGIYRPHLIHGSLGPLESLTQTASRSVQPFLKAHYCDRQTDRQTTLLGL